MDTVESRGFWEHEECLKEKWWVFHDESIPNKQWLLIGLLFVRQDNVEEVKKMLNVARQEEGYKGEIHFSKLPKSFNGCYASDARVALEWIKLYETNFCELAFFTCLAVDRKSPKYESRRFARNFHEYNRFTAMALKSGISWHLGKRNLNHLFIQFISDKKGRLSQPDKGWEDNFEDYIPYRAELDAYISHIAGKNYPKVTLNLEISDSASDELLQLTDLLLGATQEAIVAGSSRPVKQELGRYALSWCQDLKKKPWQQQYRLHRKFNVWGFPDKEGKPYNDISFALKMNPNQLSLFDENVF